MSDRQPRWVLSGAIGSGKSEVRRLLDAAGIHTVDADSVGHDVLAGPALDEVARRWPEVVESGVVDRAALGRIVFSDRAALAELESITHPLIFDRIRSDLEGFTEVAVVEIPLLQGLDDWPRIVVDASDEIRLERLLAKGMDETDARSRMSSQPSRREWLASADLVVPNHGDLGELAATVSLILPRLR